MELSVVSNQATPCIHNTKKSRYLYVFLPNFVGRKKWPPPRGGRLGTCFEPVVCPVPHGPQEAGARHIDACRQSLPYVMVRPPAGACVGPRKAATPLTKHLLSSRSPKPPQGTLLGQRLAAPIGALSLVADDMRQRHFHRLTFEISFFSRPIAEGGSEALNGDAINPHASDQHGHRHVRQFAAPLSREHQSRRLRGLIPYKMRV